MDKTGEKESSSAEQTSEYRLLSKLGKKFPRLRQTLLDLFSIDLRTLALTRVVFALIVLVDLLSRLSDLKVFYSDDGVMPRAAVHENLPHSWFISLHFLSGRAEVEALMFVISGTSCSATPRGLQNSDGNVFGPGLLFSSLCIRNPFIVHGGDNLLKMMLFWGIFVPWGARYSVDSSLNPTPGALPQESVFNWSDGSSPANAVGLFLQWDIEEWSRMASRFHSHPVCIESPGLCSPAGSVADFIPWAG